jgi:uncharacterized membrane protein YhaH (DUF805 family)
MSRRMDRKTFWIALLITVIFSQVFELALMRGLYLAIGFRAMTFLRPLMLVLMLPACILGTWRLHDVGRSGWPAWLMPIVAAAAPYTMTFSFAGMLVLAKNPAFAFLVGHNGGFMITFLSLAPTALLELGLAGWLISVRPAIAPRRPTAPSRPSFGKRIG